MISSPSVSSESEIQAEARAEVRVRKSLRDKGLEGCAGRKKGMSESVGEYGRKKPEERSKGRGRKESRSSADVSESGAAGKANRASERGRTAKR